MNWFFVCFFFSGFCSVLYELVWLRLSMAQFGVTTALVSIVLSVFMAGLGLGSWASGRWLGNHGEDLCFPVLRLYALIELLIAVSGIVVPYELLWGRRVLANVDASSSFAYYSIAALCVASTLTPWCVLMGATIPVAMRALGQMFPREAGHSFSYLYMANVAGAVAGTALPLVLIELFGFHGTLKVGAACNVLIATCAVALGGRNLIEGTARLVPAIREPIASTANRGNPLVLLFLTGLTSLGMEVVWVRQYTPYLGTVVYAFALILAVYLAATFAGSRAYRRWSARHLRESPLLWTLLALCTLFPLPAASPDVHLPEAVRLILGIAPFAGLLGFITPMLVDRFSGGNPSKAGRAYAINVVGCVLGPLVAGFWLLPYLTECWALVVLALPWLVFSLRALWTSPASSSAQRALRYAHLPLALVLIAAGRGFHDPFHESVVRRDSTATVMANGRGMGKQLYVNGYGMTGLTPVTKMMAHLPLAFLDRPPENALDICFGMGTTFRSLLTWNIQVTAVELVPSVPRLFGYFHSDGPELLKSPRAHLVIDDGRRYLESTSEQYDVITIDPPPPVQAAGSSLLYSEEFYAMARKRLRPGGLLQQFLPSGDPEDFSSIAQALRNSFPYVRVFNWKQHWGFHFLASDRPLPLRTAGELAQRLPDAAAADLVEWGPQPDAERQFAMLLSRETGIGQLIAESPSTPALRDDRPINEYYLLRQLLHGKRY